MKRSLLPALVSGTLLALAASHACAQTAITLYGRIDVGIDRILKGQGNVQGTLFGVSGTTPIPNATASPARSMTRMSPSLSTQNYFGIKGSEDLGGGYRAGIVLEGGMAPDSGTLVNDGRLFGRQGFVGLGTPYGEFRLGRQASPMLMAYHFSTLLNLGSTDVMGAGLAINNLQTYQDNMTGYLVKHGSWIGALSYSPNAGVASAISAARATAGIPATEATGQILGGASAGTETGNGRGKSYGAMVAYNASTLTLVAAYHRNRFAAPAGLATAAGFLPLFDLDKYSGAMLGVKGTLPNTGTTLAANFHSGTFTTGGGVNPQVHTVTLGVTQPLGACSITAEYVNARFTNFSEGKDKGVMVGLDYPLSKRTALYSRVGYLKDYRGIPVSGTRTPVALAGGPAVLLIPLGAVEIPTFSGAGNNMDARTSLVSVGIRHTF